MGLRATKLAGFSPPDANDAAVPITLRSWYAVDFPDDIIETGPPESFEQLTDHGSLGGDQVQGSVANQPLRVTTNGRLAAQFDNVNDVFSSSIASSNYRFLHDGTGATIFATVRVNASGSASDILNTLGAANANDTGFRLSHAGAIDGWRALVANSSGTFVINSSVNNTLPSDGLAHTLVMRWDSAGGFDVRVDGASVDSGAIVGAAAAGDPTGTLLMGARVGGGFVWDGDLLEAGAYAGLLDLATTQQLETYLTRWNG